MYITMESIYYIMDNDDYCAVFPRRRIVVNAKRKTEVKPFFFRLIKYRQYDNNNNNSKIRHIRRPYNRIPIRYNNIEPSRSAVSSSPRTNILRAPRRPCPCILLSSLQYETNII
jgi:hypothetical protein